MNFLAHILLSENIPEVMVGNFIGDHVKGHDYENYPLGIKSGIILHRFIDDFTDHHPLVHECKQYFKPEFDRYSGVLNDMYFDHVLAKHFTEYHNESLQVFSNSVYVTLGKYVNFFDPHSAQFYDYMLKNDILNAYSEKEGLIKVLKGLTHRIHDYNLLENSYFLYENNEEAITDLFRRFYMELQSFAHQKLIKLMS